MSLNFISKFYEKKQVKVFLERIHFSADLGFIHITLFINIKNILIIPEGNQFMGFFPKFKIFLHEIFIYKFFEKKQVQGFSKKIHFSVDLGFAHITLFVNIKNIIIISQGNQLMGFFSKFIDFCNFIITLLKCSMYDISHIKLKG